MTSRVLVCVPASDWCFCTENLQPITAILFWVRYVWWQSIVCFCTGTPRAQPWPGFIVQHNKSPCTEQGSSTSEQKLCSWSLSATPGWHQGSGTWKGPTWISTSSVWAQSPPHIYLGAEHKYQVLTAALEAFCLFLVHDHSALVRTNETSAGWIIPEFSCSDPLATPFQDNKYYHRAKTHEKIQLLSSSSQQAWQTFPV